VIDHSLHVLICNERLLPRFGVDRLLLLLGRGLGLRGHRVSFLCQRCDRGAVEAISRSVTELQELGRLDLHGAEAAAKCWLEEHWRKLSRESRPDVVITGGWPFFRIAEVCARSAVPSLFIDAGAIPHEGLPEGAVRFQQELRRVRAAALPRFTAVLPISNFIRDSQTLPERGTLAGVRTVLLGANHLEAPMFRAPAGDAADAACLALVERLSVQEHRLVISLGRFEPEGYKNSLAIYEVFARILEREPGARLLLLARPEDLHPPEAMRDAILPLGFLSDATLGAVMLHCALGLSLSRWEGFNLPLAEMQWCGRPVLAFNLAAHPEVTADPWLLCGSLEEMADKAIVLLQHGLPPHIIAEGRFERFRRCFRWQDVIARYAETIEGLAAEAPAQAARAAPVRRLLLVDCSNASIDPANPGVIRVARRLGHVLQQHQELCPIFIRWDLSLGAYRTLAAQERATLGSYNGPADGISGLVSPSGDGGWPIDKILGLLEAEAPPVLFVPEVVLDGRFPERIIWARARGLLVAALLYDLIPVTHQPFCSAEIVNLFPEYLEALTAADAIWAISAETLRQFELYIARHHLPRPPQRAAIWLPAQLGAQPRVTSPSEVPRPGEPLIALCVGSIDPRKNHRSLIEAFRALRRRRPHLPLHLVLAGNRFAGAHELAEWIAAVTREDPWITWTGLVRDAELVALFESATFTIYPSLVEGYGLPVVESLWMARPCLCHSQGVMAELAADGGCLTVDMTDPAAIERGLERLADDVGLRRQLAEEAVRRKLLDWAAYGAEIGSRLRDLQESDRLHPERAGRNAGRPVAAIDTTLPMLHSRLRAEAAVLRDLPERFVKVTDVPVTEAEAEHR
jgi:glycosyltransferase involved in cell wall biosynthesis